MVKNRFLSFRCDEEFIKKLDYLVELVNSGETESISRATILRRLIDEQYEYYQ
jgi:hypothetical protein